MTRITNIIPRILLLTLLASFVSFAETASAEVGSINIAIAGANNPVIANELSSMNVGIYDGLTYLNGPVGETVPQANFTGSQSYGFAIGNVNLNATNVYKIFVVLFDAGGSVNFANYSLTANGIPMTGTGSPGVFSVETAGGRSGNVVQYTIGISRAADLGTISMSLAGANNASIANELSSMNVGIYNALSYLNGPSGETIPQASFSGAGNYGFTLSNINLNPSNTYTITAVLFGSSNSVNLSNYSLTANNTSLSGNASGVFSGAVAGVRSGNNVSYQMTISRNTPAPTSTQSNPTASPVPQASVAAGGPGSTIGSIDTTPKNPKVVINNGSAFTTSTSVTLKPDATGPKATMQMLISNFEDFKDAEWGAFRAEKSWTFSDDYGTKTVYAKFRDYYGNTSVVATGSIAYVEKIPESASSPTSVQALTLATSTPTSTEVSVAQSGGEILGVTGFRFTKDLELGMKNSDVSALQKILGEEKFFSSEATGVFGLETLKAVKAYQRGKGIIPTGIVGPKTRASLNKNIPSSKFALTSVPKKETNQISAATGIKFGDNNEIVKKIQTDLIQKKAELLKVLEQLLIKLQQNQVR